MLSKQILILISDLLILIYIHSLKQTMNKFCSNLVRAIRNFKNVEASSFKCVFSCSSKRHFSHTNHIEKSKLHDIEIPKVLLHEYLWEGLDKWSNRIALVRFHLFGF